MSPTVQDEVPRTCNISPLHLKQVLQLVAKIQLFEVILLLLLRCIFFIHGIVLLLFLLLALFCNWSTSVNWIMMGAPILVVLFSFCIVFLLHFLGVDSWVGLPGLFI